MRHHYEELQDLLSDEPDIKVYAGAQALCDIVEAEPIDMVLASMVGFSGLGTDHPCHQGPQEDLSCQQGNPRGGR